MCATLVDLEHCCTMYVWLQQSASTQPRTQGSQKISPVRMCEAAVERDGCSRERRPLSAHPTCANTEAADLYSFKRKRKNIKTRIV